MHSAIYTGQLRHRRFAPREHAFSYSLFMMYVDLAELDTLFKGRWLWSAKRPALAWLRRADYLGDRNIPLDQAVRDRVEEETGNRPAGPIRMLTHLRYFGIGFNPVTFYYCYDQSDTKIEVIVAEITNTPWQERHVYVLKNDTALNDTSSLLPTSAERAKNLRMFRFLFKKTFHVSPFMAMNFDYDWRFSNPCDRLTVHMQNMQSGGKAFDATLDLRRREISGTALATTLISFPIETAKVIVGIYWQALRLWLKRIPFHPHPHKTLHHERDIRRPTVS